MTRNTLANELTKLYDGAVREYGMAVEADRSAQARDGAKEIKDGFAYPYFEQNAQDAVFNARARALDEISREMTVQSRKLTAPPSESAARYIASISGRDDLTADEVRAALDTYTDHPTQHAVLAAAVRSGLKEYLDEKTETERYIDDIRKAESDVVRFFTPHSVGNATQTAIDYTTARGALDAVRDDSSMTFPERFYKMLQGGQF